MDVLSAIRGALERNGLVNSGASLLAAVSGGADSMALLHALNALRGSCRFELTIAHFDHRIRASSGLDALFVREAAEKLGAGCVIGSGDVPALARDKGVSLETAAREARYEFLREAARESGAAFVALAHNKGDQTETLLMHILRGSGLNGLCGMREAENGLLRPLLNVDRNEIEAFCASYGVEYRTDETNAQALYTRNRVRLELLPLLRSFNPAFDDAAQRLLENARRDCDALDRLAFEAYVSASRPVPNGVALDAQKLAALPKALSSRVALLAVNALLGEKTDFELGHVDGALSLLSKRTGALVNLPRGVSAALGYGELLIIRQESYIFDIRFQKTARTPFGAFTAGKAGPYSAMLDEEKLRQAHARARRPGDWMRPKGLGGRKKVQDLLVDVKIPQIYRDALPLLAFGDEVLFIPGVRESEPPPFSGVLVNFEPDESWPLHPKWQMIRGVNR